MTINKKDKYKYQGIYLIKIGEYNYIGQSVNIQSRINQHKNQLKNNKHHNSYMQNVYNKYQTFEYKILFKNIEKEYLTILEQICINYYSNVLNLKAAENTDKFTVQHKLNISTSLKNSIKVQESIKTAFEIQKEYKKERKQQTGNCKTEKQLKSSRQAVKSMNTKEANLKSALSRKNNINVRNAIRKSVGDLKNYLFVNKITGEEFKGLRSDFNYYLKEKYNVVNCSARVFEIVKGKSFKGWLLHKDEIVDYKSKYKCNRSKGLESNCADKTIYSFINTKTNEMFIGSRFDFANLLNVTSKQLSGLLTCKDLTYHKWKINCCNIPSPR